MTGQLLQLEKCRIFFFLIFIIYIFFKAGDTCLQLPGAATDPAAGETPSDGNL